MNEREAVFSAVRAGLPPAGARMPRPPVTPVCARPLPGEISGPERFLRLFQEANGRILRSWDELAAHLRGNGTDRGYIDPALRPEAESALAGIPLETVFDRAQVDHYAFGITRAAGAIAETGSLVLTSEGTPARLAALAPWTHVAVLRQADIFDTVSDAIAAFGNDPAIAWVTGPSKTADIEGILVEGVHGPGVQMCLLI